MKTGLPIRFWAAGLLLCAAAGVLSIPKALAQTDLTPAVQLLGKAHALEVRGRMDMAKQIWQQVLLVDPNNSEALAGMARAAKLEGKNDDANRYLERLRAMNPSDPNIARVEATSTTQNQSADLQRAGRLAQAGQYAQAMTILRKVYGDTPPPGDGALSYYQTEAATEDGRPHAIAGLRMLMDRYPQDSRYQIALGKILTYNPRTRDEGRKLLQKHPASPDASEALRQSLVWDAQNPATSADIRAYLSKHRDQQLSTALAQTQAGVDAANRARRNAGRGPALTPEQQAAQAAFRERSAEDNAAYAALNAKRIDDAEARFKAILAKNATDTQALAGLGYVRMQQSNFGGAISYLEQAQNDGSKDPSVEKALRDSRFFYTMQEATAALNENDLVTAQKQFQMALGIRSNDPEALLGLGGTLLKAQQPEPAINVFTTFVKVKPGEKAAWRGLFTANYGAGKYTEALAVEKRIPPAVRAQLLRDPDYLRTLASVYSAVGRDADAQRVLRSALDLPFPADARGVKADTQMQYAALLSAAGHKDQAAGLYRQVLAGDSTNTTAWAGLVQTQHEVGQDQAALQTLESMPAQNFTAAMQEPGFETTVAAIYVSQNRNEQAQDVLEKFLAKQRTEGKKPFLPAQEQLAGLYLQRGNSAQAYPLYREILALNGDRPDAWKGLLTALHSSGHDREALAQLQQVPPAMRKTLEADPAYLQTVGSIYAGLGQPQEAMLFLNRAEQHYTATRTTPPADIDIQSAWLLYNSQNDARLYPALMALGARADLSDDQRRTVQQIWANFATRRANQAAAAGNIKYALAVLNAAAASFPGNPAVIKALASGYAQAGLPKQAVAIFKSQDLTTASAADYKAAVGAALADNDLKDAEVWLRFGLDQYPHDPQMLNLAARFEQARGDSGRAAEYYRTALAAMPAPDPGSQLATALSQLPAQALVRRAPTPAATGFSNDLSTLLSTPTPSAAPRSSMQTMQRQETRPYLPGSPASPMSSGAPVPMGAPMYGAPSYGTPGYGTPAYGEPAYGTPGETAMPMNPGQSTLPANPSTTRPRSKTTLKDYQPQTQNEPHMPLGGVIRLHPDAAMERVYGPYVSYDGSVETSAVALARAHAPESADGLHTVAFQHSSTADGTPIVPYAATAQPVQATHKRTPNAQARVRAAAIRSNQESASEGMTGVSHPPAENYDVLQNPLRQEAPAQPASKLSPAQFNAAAQQGAQVQQPQSLQAAQAAAANQPKQTGDSAGQQYPQPRSHGVLTPAPTVDMPVRTSTRRRRTRKTAPVQAAEPAAPAQPLTYPTYGQPHSNPGLPQVAQPYPLPAPPTDQDLVQHNIPPLRAYYDPRIHPKQPLSEREQTELDLATLEAGYSGWVGGSVKGRYRSGTPGIDRLSVLEVPFEASAVLGKTMRVSVVPKAVFLNSGVLDTTTGALGTNPVLGTLPGNATFAPQQQFASGIGGELQIRTHTLSAAIGYTPYQFLVSNIIGRVRWTPGAGHFTFYGGRDAVEQTQLSYAGLRDPGSASTLFGGNVWGGVVETGGGIRFDSGDERAGLYASVEGTELTGYHVLDNRKYAGTMGAYFRVKNYPQYGSLNVGGTLFGEHYDHNERGQTYGLGGYFSPEAYFLAAVPVSFNGHYGTGIHYTVNGSVGVQTFQEDNQIYFPLDPALQATFTIGCTVVTNRSCGQLPVNSNTGLNYSLDAQGSYQVNDHWFVGAFVTGNNTNNYNTISGGFFARYLFRPQFPTTDGPTGLFPIEGFRPLLVP